MTQVVRMNDASTPYRALWALSKHSSFKDRRPFEMKQS